MSFSSWLRSIFSPTVKRSHRRQNSRSAVTCKPRLEVLEDRNLLTLNPALNFAAIANPHDADFGDFNGDGFVDVATINNSQLSIVHGNGDGTLDAPQTWSATTGLSSLAAGHFNSDNRLDLVYTSTVTRWTGTAYVTEGWVTVLLNNGNDANGNATFQSARTYSTGTNIRPGAAAVGDLNGDSKLDVVVAETTGSRVTVLLGNGDGTLQSGQHFDVGSSPGSVAVGDFNDDDKLDIVTANRGSSNVSVLINNGTATNLNFAAAQNSAINGAVQSVAVGDLNEDGTLDLAVTSNIATSHTYWYYGYYGGLYYGTYYTYEGFVNVLLGSGTGTFGAATATYVTGNEIGDLTTGDLNGDGLLDVVTSDGIVRPYIDPTVLLGRGDGSFDAPFYFAAGYGPNSVMVADFNGDDAPDVATANLYSSTVSILLNDSNWPPPGAPLVSISGPSSTILEQNDLTTTVSFTITLSTEFSDTVTVQYQTVAGSALAGSDYLTNVGTATFIAGETSQTIEVQVVGDKVPEWDEYFAVVLSNPTNARMGVAQAYVTIEDNEPRVTISDVSIVEGNGETKTAVFTVSLSRSYSDAVSVNFSTVEGDTQAWTYYDYYGNPYPLPPAASAGSDFTSKSGQVTFAPGVTEATIEIEILGDRTGEETEYFSVDLSSDSTNAMITDGHGLGAIVDDEPRISISPAYSPTWQNLAYQSEGNTGTKIFRFAVTMSNAYDEPVSVSYATANSSATAGVDYVAQNGTLTFKPGESLTQYIDVVVNGDNVAESTEYFYVSLSNPTAGVIAYSQAYGTILDDEPTISISDVYKSEGNSGTTEFVFAVRLSRTYEETVTVNFQTVNGTALSGSDYQFTSGTLTFLPGETVKYITVLVIGDTSKESGESFSVQLTGNSSNATLYDAWAYGYIENDDTSTTPGKGNGRKK